MPTSAVPVTRTLGLFGGSFDPIHLGHLRMALEAKRSLALDELRLMPCYQSPHKESAGASALEREQMLTLALEGCTELTLELRELHRPGPSYTVETLETLRCELGDDVSLVLLMGTDAYQSLDCWHRWQSLREFSHLVVVERPGFHWPEGGILRQWLETPDPLSIVHQQTAGGFVVLKQRLLDISATDIRRELALGQVPHFLLPAKVIDYIQTQAIYPATPTK